MGTLSLLRASVDSAHGGVDSAHGDTFSAQGQCGQRLREHSAQDDDQLWKTGDACAMSRMPLSCALNVAQFMLHTLIPGPHADLGNRLPGPRRMHEGLAGVGQAWGHHQRRGLQSSGAGNPARLLEEVARGQV